MAQKHITVYRGFFNIGEQDIPLCENCHSNNGVEIHHIYSRKYNTYVINDTKHSTNDIKNLIGLCRSCHIKAHKSELKKDYLMLLHKIYMKQHGI